MKSTILKCAVLVVVTGLFLLLVFSWFFPMTVRRGDSNQVQRNSTIGGLKLAHIELEYCATGKPMGLGCGSLQEAVGLVHDTRPQLLRWSYWEGTDYNTNGSIHLNPDWNKWQANAADSDAFGTELALFARPQIVGTNGTQSVFYGLTFKDQAVELTNPPSWPPATAWLKGSQTSKQPPSSDLSIE